MLGRPLFRRLGVLAAACVAGPTMPQGSSALAALENGLWEVRGVGNERIATICLGNPAQLAQPRHRGQNCEQTVTGREARSVTITYSCPGAGSGRTELRIETPRLVQIESQGLDRGTPFALRAEARRTGVCPAS